MVLDLYVGAFNSVRSQSPLHPIFPPVDVHSPALLLGECCYGLPWLKLVSLFWGINWFCVKCFASLANTPSGVCFILREHQLCLHETSQVPGATGE